MPAATSTPSRSRWRTARPLPRWPAGWSLRARLLAALIALLTVVCLVVGVVTVAALDSFLLGQLDQQLAAAGTRSQGAVGGVRGVRARTSGPGRRAPSPPSHRARLWARSAPASWTASSRPMCSTERHAAAGAGRAAGARQPAARRPAAHAP
ncbi:MAG TPA: hypothetical protein VFA45_01725, partial [Actinomycetes bacterium]|nr:hypothetical protein [Actinomycetes bacterium]